MTRKKRVTFQTKYGKVSFLTGKSKYDIMRKELKKGIVE